MIFRKHILDMLGFFIGWQFAELGKVLLTDYTFKKYFLWGICLGLAMGLFYAITIELIISTARKWKKK
jgi:hypothetical protein